MFSRPPLIRGTLENYTMTRYILNMYLTTIILPPQEVKTLEETVIIKPRYILNMLSNLYHTTSSRVKTLEKVTL